VKKTLLPILLAAFIMSACNNKEKAADNPFLADYGTPFEIPAFDKITPEHITPAIEQGMTEQMQAIEAIVNSEEPATFVNTIEALENSGMLLNKVSSVFGNMMSMNTSDTLQAIAKALSPKMSKHSDDITLNAKLFERVKAVYSQKESLGLSAEQAKLLEETFKGFVRSGANLNDAQKEEMRKINEDLSLLTLQFGDNVLKNDNTWKLIIEKEEDLAGCPESLKQALADAAKEAGNEGKWMVTLHKSSWIPFLTYAANRDLRKQVYTAWMNRGNNNDENDNKANAAKIASLRVKKANLMGFPTWAHFVLNDNMAKNPEAAMALLTNLWERALPIAKKELAEMQKLADSEGAKFKLESCDWWYYAEKVRKAKYDLDEEALRPYFELNNVKNGMFTVLEKLYGIKMVERTDLPKPHADAIAYEVQEADGKHVGVFFMDFHPRASKQGGAWMSNYRDQSRNNGEMISPIVTNVLNFTKPTATEPSLLTFDEVSTMFHEMGHGLHGLLSDCNYRSLSGTAVSRDFVELPSQIMEHWASEPQVLKMFAKHYKTGEVIPDELINKVVAASKFNQGFTTIEYLAASILDLNWHMLTTADLQDVEKFEAESMNKIGLINEIIPRYRSTYFSHIFSGGYSAGYYAYIWAEVLDADAYTAFMESGDIFNKEIAKSFRDNVLSRGGTEDPMVLYKKFRGAEPKIEALLKNRGLDGQPK